MLQERDERFAVGLLVQRSAAIWCETTIEALEIRRDIEEALRPQEIPGPWLPSAAHEPQVLVQHGVRRTRGQGHVPAAALGVETGGDRDRLHQRRLAAAVLAREEGHLRVELQLVEVADRWDRERIGLEVLDSVPLQDDRADEGIVQTSRQR